MVVDEIPPLGLGGGHVGRLADHLLGEVRVAPVSFRECAHIGGCVVTDLSPEHLVLVAASERDRRG